MNLIQQAKQRCPLLERKWVRYKDRKTVITKCIACDLLSPPNLEKESKTTVLVMIFQHHQWLNDNIRKGGQKCIYVLAMGKQLQNETWLEQHQCDRVKSYPPSKEGPYQDRPLLYPFHHFLSRLWSCFSPGSA